MKALVRAVFYDVILASIYIAFDIYLIYFYLDQGDKWWGAATIGAVCLPGLIEFLVYTYSFLHGDLKGTKCQQLCEYLLWTFFSLFYPISLVVWHLIQICRGENNYLRYETVARSRILNSLSVLTKSAAQLLLQTTVIMIIWYQKSLGYHIYVPISAAFSVLMLANSCTSHHYFESSGKLVHQSYTYSQRTRRFMFNILHVVFRGFTVGLLGAYLHFYILAILGAMIIANLVTALLVINTSWSKHFMTAFAAVLLPTCFISKEDIPANDAGFGRRIFSKFYRINAICFLMIVVVGGLITANCILYFTDHIQFSCTNLPFLSYDSINNCPENSVLADVTPPLSDIFNPLHAWFHVVGSSIILILGIVEVFLVCIEERCCLKDYCPVNRM